MRRHPKFIEIETDMAPVHRVIFYSVYYLVVLNINWTRMFQGHM